MRFRESASARLRLAVSAAVGLVAGVATSLGLPLEVAVLVAWDALALTFLLWVWPVMLGLNADKTAKRASQEDNGRAAADLMLLCASVASLLAVGLVVVRAGNSSGMAKAGL